MNAKKKAADIETMKVAEAAARLGVHTQTIYRMGQSGALPVLRLGRHIRISKVVFQRFLEGRTE